MPVRMMLQRQLPERNFNFFVRCPEKVYIGNRYEGKVLPGVRIVDKCTNVHTAQISDERRGSLRQTIHSEE